MRQGSFVECDGGKSIFKHFWAMQTLRPFLLKEAQAFLDGERGQGSERAAGGKRRSLYIVRALGDEHNEGRVVSATDGKHLVLVVWSPDTFRRLREDFLDSSKMAGNSVVFTDYYYELVNQRLVLIVRDCPVVLANSVSLTPPLTRRPPFVDELPDIKDKIRAANPLLPPDGKEEETPLTESLMPGPWHEAKKQTIDTEEERPWMFPLDDERDWEIPVPQQTILSDILHGAQRTAMPSMSSSSSLPSSSPSKASWASSPVRGHSQGRVLRVVPATSPAKHHPPSSPLKPSPQHHPVNARHSPPKISMMEMAAATIHPNDLPPSAVRHVHSETQTACKVQSPVLKKARLVGASGAFPTKAIIRYDLW
jgi:hypothetical protein